MAFFSRKQIVDSSESDQVDYLDAPDTVGRPMALVSIVLIVLLIAAILFAGLGLAKWLQSRNNAKSPTIGQTTSDVAPLDNNGQNSDTQSSNTQESGNTPAEVATTDNSSANTNSGSSAENSNTTNATVPTAGGVDDSNAEGAVTNTGQLPNTGASANIFALFVLTTFGSAFAYRIYLSKKLS